MSRIFTNVAKDAFEQNAVSVFKKTAQSKKVPIVFRAPSQASMPLIQNGNSTKPHSINNKSSIMQGLEGMIPCNGLAGKQGDKLRKFRAQGCIKSFEDCAKEEKYLEGLVENENQMIRQKLDERDEEGNHRYEALPIRREVNGQKQILVFTDSTAKETKWVEEPKLFPPPNLVEVLAAPKKTPITADIDLFFVGQPKGQAHEVIYDPSAGFGTHFSHEIRTDLNESWKETSHNDNDVIQHGEESYYGLNPIDDELVAVSPSGTVSHFDLRAKNPTRGKELIAYGRWLKQHSDLADVSVPTPEMQKTRADYLKKSFGYQIDYSSAAKDYSVLRQILEAPSTQKTAATP